MNDKIYYFFIGLGLVLIFLVGIFIITYYFKITTNECLANPLVYGAKQLEIHEGVKVFGTVSFYNHPEVRIIFDSKNISVNKN